MKSENYSLSHKVLIIVGIVLLTLTVTFIIIKAIEVFLLIFAGILLAIFLRGLANQLCKILPISMNISLVIVIFLLIIITAAGVFLMGPSIMEGFNNLREKIPAAINNLEESVSELPWGAELREKISSTYTEITSDSDFISSITGIFSTTLGTIVNIFVILIIGLYSAFDPDLYIEGTLKLIPQKKRKHTREVFEAINKALSWWFVGTFASMFIIGILTFLGLWILGIPLAFTLGVLAAILTFIPNIGPLISAFPPILIALIDSPAKALYVVLLYIGIQTVETYLITPAIQKSAVSMPPALLIAAQILMGIILGIFGLVIATPLMVVIIVLVQTLYVKDSLGDTVEVMGETQE